MTFLTKVRKIDGWLTNNEATLLYNLAKRNKFNGVIVEIGSWKGKSTVCLAKGSLEGAKNKIYAIDPFTAPGEKLKDYLEEQELSTFEMFKKNIQNAGVESIIVPLIKFSYEAVHLIKEEIDLIFIDGSHEYEDVLNDFLLFFPKVRIGGVIAFHDTNGGGPNKVVVERLYNSSVFKQVRFVDSITYGVKVGNASMLNRLKNYYRLILFRNFNRFRRADTPGFIKAFGKLIYKIVR